jgi:phage shock protein PspC (stress-responsive transcriptional regulator)
MQRVIVVAFDGHTDPFRMHEDADAGLRRYLDDAAARLAGDPDRAEVIADLERSIASRLAERRGSEDRILAVADVEAVLADVGPVGAGEGTAGIATGSPAPRPRGRRRLVRIREGQWIAGVCTGLAAYSEIDLDWVRTIFLLLTVLTAGLLIFVYVALALILPVVPTKAAWAVAQDDA